MATGLKWKYRKLQSTRIPSPCVEDKRPSTCVAGAEYFLPEEPPFLSVTQSMTSKDTAVSCSCDDHQPIIILFCSPPLLLLLVVLQSRAKSSGNHDAELLGAPTNDKKKLKPKTVSERFRTVFDSLNIFHRADVDGRTKHTHMRTPFWIIASLVGLEKTHKLLTHAQLGLTCLEGRHEIIKLRMWAIDVESYFLERKFVQISLCITHRSTCGALSVLHDEDKEFSPVFIKIS